MTNDYIYNSALGWSYWLYPPPPLLWLEAFDTSLYIPASLMNSPLHLASPAVKEAWSINNIDAKAETAPYATYSSPEVIILYCIEQKSGK